MTVVYFIRAEISFRFVKVRPELIEERSLTNREVNSLEKACSKKNYLNSFFMGLDSCCYMFLGRSLLR